MTACNNNDNGLPATVKFRNAEPPANINMSVGRSIISGTTDHPYRKWPVNTETGRNDITVSDNDGNTTITMATLLLFPEALMVEIILK